MDIRFDPPRLEGSSEEQLRTLVRWLASLCEKLNISFAELSDRISEEKGK